MYVSKWKVRVNLTELEWGKERNRSPAGTYYTDRRIVTFVSRFLLLFFFFVEGVTEEETLRT